MHKNLILILFLIVSSIVLAGARYKPIKIKQEQNRKITVGDHNLLITNDSTFNKLYCRFVHNNIIIPDSADYSAYGSRINVYASKASKDTLIIWSIENEYSTEMHYFYLNNGVVFKIGELTPLTDCSNCDSRSYPLSKIRIIDNRISIQLKFTLSVILDNQEKGLLKENTYIEYKKQYF